MPVYIQAISDWAQFIITIGAVIALIKTVAGNVQAPDKAQNERIEKLEKRLDKVDERLEKGDTHFKSIDETSKVTLKALLALLDHGINGNDIDKLKKAINDVENYLTDK